MSELINTFPSSRLVTNGGAAARPARKPQPSSFRLTARGRILVALLGTCAFFMGWITLGGGSADASVESASSIGQVVVVQPGESLWSIATDIAPDTDPREVIIRIREMNNLGADHVYPGQSLSVPAL